MKIKSITKKESQLTVDIEVSKTHTYQLSNGCVSHNTGSLALGTSSGIHNWYDLFYTRRMRVGKNEALYRYLFEKIPALVEDCKFKPHLEAVMSFPQKAPEGALLRSEPFMNFLETVKRFNLEWVRSGHVSGANYHNVSCTINLKPNEWKECGEWMWDNREHYTGMSVIPYDNGSYVQAPFESITEDKYNEMFSLLSEINLDDVIEEEDNTHLTDQVACSGGNCEV